MAQYLTNVEERQIRELIDELAGKLGLHSDKRETHFAGFYVDRLWYRILEGDKVPFIAFEIEKGIPNNERIRKDIMNMAWTRAPVGYIILPHTRILNDPQVDKGSSWPSWYKNKFFETFSEYKKPFIFYCNIRAMDADKLLSTRSLRKSIISSTQ